MGQTVAASTGITAEPTRARRPQALHRKTVGGRKRRGTIYVVVLGVAMIVSMVGLMAIMVVRIERRQALTGFELGEAADLAKSSIELCITTLVNDPAWRSTYTHNTWQPAQSFGNGSFQWKLVADSGDLSNPPGGLVKIVGQGVVNGFTQEYGVYVQGNAPSEIVMGTWTIE